MNTEIFKTDLKKLVQLLQVIRLRRERLLAFLYALTAPVESLYRIFAGNRDSNLYRLLITPQVCYLERFLNNRYDTASRRIRIVNAFYADIAYLFLRAENKPVSLFTRAENRPVHLFTRGETSIVPVDFIIAVPADISINENQMRGEVDSYKLAGKKYQIIRP
jgi:hypothetical protein